MIAKYFKCTLLTDIVINSSLATEGNMRSLDYIPGSSFLGIVAKKLYTENNQKTFDIFHSGKVSFGNALISKDDKVSYAIPFSLFQDKLANNICKDTVWVHHGIENVDGIKDEEENKIQLKQKRSGYFNTDFKYIKEVEKEFSLKSAYDREKRRSADKQMYGFEAIKAGQEFIFSVIFKDEKYVDEVSKALIGIQQIGKSKTAQYGLVRIEAINKPKVFERKPIKNGQLVIYAESDLCFLNELGQPIFQPKPKDFGVNGEIKWDKSQVRTRSYSLWNSKRNTADVQRDVILKGSVIVIEGIDSNLDINSLQRQVGEYNAEGLGRVIYNPEFLEYDENGIWKIKLYEYKQNKTGLAESVEIKSTLGKYLLERKRNDENELKLSKKIIEVLNSSNAKALINSNISKSQWGAIRQKALLASSIDDLYEELLNENNGFLVRGVAAERYWDKENGKYREILKIIIDKAKQDRELADLGTIFIAKLVAEIAKK